MQSLQVTFFSQKSAYKRILASLLFIFISFSCAKNSNQDSIADPGFIEFKINGQYFKVVYSNPPLRSPLFFSKSSGLNFNFIWYSSEGYGQDIDIEISVITDTLEIKNYHYDSHDVARDMIYVITLRTTIKGEAAVIHSAGDFADINITSHKNSRISGTFSGTLTPQLLPLGFGIPGSIKITEGKINEVKVLY